MLKNYKKGFNYIGVSIVYFCVDGKGNLLMHFRNRNTRDEHEVWDVGGGGLRFGERVEDALKREIREEYCAEVLEYEFLCYQDVHREHNKKPTHWVALNFLVLVDREQVKNGEPDKFDKIRWFSRDETPKNLHSAIPEVLEEYSDKIFEKNNTN